MKTLALFILFVSSYSHSSVIHLDIGQTQTVFNRISIPKNRDSQLTLPTEDSLGSYRVTGFFNLASGNSLYVLIAPLEAEYNFSSDKNFKFNETDFTAETDTTLNYKFNSYRLGYMWNFGHQSFKYWLGVTGKIRDANTEVVQGDSSDSFSNIGFVPLLSLGLDLRLFEGLSLYSHTDALGASQGSAYDSQIELKFGFNGFALSLGRRILGGGADNDTVFNFAQFDTNYLRLSYGF